MASSDVMDGMEQALAEVQAELDETQRRVHAAWSELTHAQNALQRTQQKWLDVKLRAKQNTEATPDEPSKPHP